LVLYVTFQLGHMDEKKSKKKRPNYSGRFIIYRFCLFFRDNIIRTGVYLYDHIEADQLVAVLYTDRYD